MLNTININLKTDIKTDRPTALGIKLMSQDKNNNQFILRFTNGGEPVTLDDTYTVEILTKFSNSGASRLTSAIIRQDYATWEFDTSFITQDEKVVNYVYVRKSGSLVVSADANAFAFDVGLSEIDKDAGRVAEVYDENYEKVLADYSGALDERTTERLDEAVLDFNQRGDVEIADWREYADVELEDYLSDRVVLKNSVTNGDFSQGTTGWTGILETTLSVADGFIRATRGSNYVYFGQSINHADISKNDVSYLSMDLKSSKTDAIQFRMANAIGTSLSFNFPSTSGSLTIKKYSGVFRRESDVVTGALSILGPTYTGDGDFIEVKNVLLLNLTKIFGAGNEPSKEWMDRLIEQTGYFDEYILDEKWQVREILRLEYAKANKVQEDWITPTLLNGATGSVRYRKNEFGRIEIIGRITAATANTAVFNLPPGYRTVATLGMVAATDATPTVFIINGSGDVLLRTTALHHLSGISYLPFY